MPRVPTVYWAVNTGRTCVCERLEGEDFRRWYRSVTTGGCSTHRKGSEMFISRRSNSITSDARPDISPVSEVNKPLPTLVTYGFLLWLRKFGG